ncbi:MFS transporter [Propionibacteriaceae bacterium Y1923]
MLALAVGAQVVGTFFASAPAYLIPQLHATQGMSLAAAGALAAAPTIGKVFTLVAWGAMADRIGERWVIGAGLTLTATFSAAAGLVSGNAWLAVLLVLGGAASASTDVGSGRVIVGWFPRGRRGLAMGIR